MNNTNIHKNFFAVSGPKRMGIGIQDLIMTESGEKALLRLMAFKAGESKNDPERRQGLHGPYEELVRQKTGQLPADYYEDGDDRPWGLRLNESRSNILWQVLSGMIDHRPEFAAAYMGLALSPNLSVDDYSKELNKIHKSWGDYQATKGMSGQHLHGAMKSQYRSVACPACSVLTAMVCQDVAMNDLFQKLIPMNFEERNFFMSEQGFAPLLNVMIPDQPNIYIERHI